MLISILLFLALPIGQQVLAACSAPTITSPADGGTFTTRMLTFRGTSMASSASGYVSDCGWITITVGGVTYPASSTNTIAESGNWQYQVGPISLANGQYSVSVVSGQNANTSPAATLTINTAINRCAPAIVTSPAAGYTFADETPVIRGKFAPGTGETFCPSFGVTTSDGQTGTTVVNPDGTFVVNGLSRFPSGNTVITFNSDDISIFPSTSTFTVSASNTASCQQATLSVATQNNVFGTTTPYLYGYAPAGGDCNMVHITLKTSGGGMIHSTMYPTNANAGFYWEYPVLNPLTSGSSYIVSLVVGSDSNLPPTRASAVADFPFVINTDQCPEPVISASSATSADPRPQFTVTPGSNDPNCIISNPYFSGSPSGFQPGVITAAGGNTFIVSPQRGLYSQTWTLNLFMADADGNRASSVVTRSITINGPQCVNTPVITGPLQGQIVRQTSAFRPTISAQGQAGCTQVNFRFENTRLNQVLESTATISDDPGAQTAFYGYQGLTPGETYTLSVTTSYPGGGSPSSVASRSFTVDPGLCPTPIITSPLTGTSSTRNSLSISGSQDMTYALECTVITVMVNGIKWGEAQAAAAPGRRKRASDPWTISNPFPLVPGKYSITTFSGQDADQSANSDPVEYEVLSTDSQPSGNLRRRRIACGFKEELCTSVGPKGKLIQECIGDLDTNLERCGACDGPDCTLIPNVDEVQCLRGMCMISSCVEGYAVVGEQCIPQDTSALAFAESALEGFKGW